MCMVFKFVLNQYMYVRVEHTNPANVLNIDIIVRLSLGFLQN